MTALDTIIGHDSTVSTLQRSIKSGGRFSHAMLFNGPPSVGKRTTALAFLQALHCRSRGDDGNRLQSCGECPACQRFQQRTHPDFTYLTVEEGKTRISIDQIRALCHFLTLSSLEGGWKSALIDDAVFLSEGAANALLKTLEEPTPKTVLILVTERPGALLPTIRSRCNQLRFSPLDEASLRAIILQQEKRQERSLPTEQHMKRVDAALFLSGGRIDTALAAVRDENQMELWETFSHAWESFTITDLAKMNQLAEKWGKETLFPRIMRFISLKLFHLLKQNVREQKSGIEVRRLIDLQKASHNLRDQQESYNTNRRLILESLFIRIAMIRNSASNR
ncbi:MAG: DNA polymerase III subunit delta' [Magnetococcales bacterium]|nr:DNA polymerase III subunit delta' [Magnetococcales bacterium]